MSSPFGMYGGYTYESTESRALGSITSESYDYRDQAKLTSKLVNDVSYMAGYMRKMQKGIDDASQNFMQQIQSFINDVLVLLGGQGDTGFDFGDLKYILQGFGALFGFKPGMPLPINLFSAAWHFISNYVLPNQDFKELLNMTVDGIIATALDIFGEVPIVGQALQQLAIIISDIRDLLMTIVDSVEKFFGAFNISLGDIQGIGNFFNPLKPIFDTLTTALNGVVLPDFAAVLRIIGGWTLPLVNGINDIIGALTYLVKLITGQEDLTKLKKALENIVNALALDKLLNAAGQLDLGSWAGAFLAKIGVQLQAAIEGILKAPAIIAELLKLLKITDLVDGIAGIITPAGAAVVGGINGALAALGQILGISQGAEKSAGQASIAVQELEAKIAGGGADEFDYSLSPSLPSPWVATYTGTGTSTWGPDGNGLCVIKLSGAPMTWRDVHYRLNTMNPPLIKADCSVSVVLSKPPHDDAMVKSYFYLEIQKNATNQEAIRAKIGVTTVQFESVNATGTVNSVGPVHQIAAAKANDTYVLKAEGTKLTLIKNKITQATQTFTPLGGRLVGFGATQPGFAWLFGGHPAPEFMGFTWQ